MPRRPICAIYWFTRRVGSATPVDTRNEAPATMPFYGVRRWPPRDRRIGRLRQAAVDLASRQLHNGRPRLLAMAADRSADPRAGRLEPPPGARASHSQQSSWSPRLRLSRRRFCGSDRGSAKLEEAVRRRAIEIRTGSDACGRGGRGSGGGNVTTSTGRVMIIAPPSQCWFGRPTTMRRERRG